MIGNPINLIHINIYSQCISHYKRRGNIKVKNTKFVKIFFPIVTQWLMWHGIDFL